MEHVETTTEFDGDTGMLILLALCCLPLGFFYYVSEKETKLVCPQCRETVNEQATRCPYCQEQLQYDQPHQSDY